MHGLHCLPYHTHQVVIEGFQVCLVPELGREGFQGLRSIVLTAVEAPVYEGLYAPPQRVEQGCYQERGSYHREGGLFTGEKDEDSLEQDDVTDVEREQHCRQRPIYKGTVDDPVYVVEAVPQDRDTYGHQQTR